MNRGWLAAGAIGACLMVSACSQPYGPGMMGFGMPGPGAMSPGMMGGSGWGEGGCGYGAGMMGGGYGPGMMGGHGPGMMGGDAYGLGWSMGEGGMGGPGMRGRHGPGGYGAQGLQQLDLSDAQRTKIREIETEFQRKRWDLMRSAHELMWNARSGAPGAAADAQAQRQAYDAMAAMHRQMFELSVDARTRIDAVLTPEQRERLRRGPGRG